MTDTVYIVTAGEYSSYHIVAVFADKEAADAFVAQHQGAFGNYGDDGQIEEWQIATRDILTLTPYYVVMDATGQVDRVRSSLRDIGEAQQGYTNVASHRDGTSMVTYSLARDDAHAIKIANERRSILLGLERWVPGDHSSLFR
jgi:hypothetical protein